MRLALVQFNPMVGDIAGNAAAIIAWCRRAMDARAGLVVFPELALTGYPPKDLLLQEGFVAAAERTVADIARRIDPALTAVVGAPMPLPGARVRRATNSALVLKGGLVAHRYDKRLLPTYDVFDEDRYFTPGNAPCVIDVAGVPTGVSICEDLWRADDADSDGRYLAMPDPVAELIGAGAKLVINLSASPFVLGKGARQRDILARHVRAHRVCVGAVNQVGGNDDLVFDGHAVVFVPGEAGQPRLIAAGPGFTESVVVVDLDPGGAAPPAVTDPLLTAPREELLWKALVLGTRDYARKCSFRAALLGLSGGIDSALAACIAAAALGPGNVTGVLMPSRYSSKGSVDDAHSLARSLSIACATVPIEPTHVAMESVLADAWRSFGLEAGPPGLTEENLQSRIRGAILMAISNKSGALLLTTGNKSELAVGYCTLYGDMNGGLAVLSDITKQDVYSLARWVNANHGVCGFAKPPIPDSSLTKAPSAELRPNQTDQDSLPPYEVLDELIERYVERRQSAATIVNESGIDPAVVRRILRLVDTSEYKRKQMPVGIKVTSVTFGPGRRFPIAQGWGTNENQTTAL